MVKIKILVSKIKEMKDKLIMLLQISVVLAVIYIATAMLINSIENNSTKPIFTDNMKDCQEKGGEYVLRINPDGKIWLERCEISREFDYYNK